VTVLAAIRPDEVNLALFVHVLGAMLLVGALFTVAAATVMGWRRTDDAATLTRFSLRTVLLGVLPAYIVMRVGAQWTEAKADYPDDFEPAWIGVGYITADAGALLILVSIVLSALGLRRLKRGSGVGFGRAVGVISILLVAAYVIAVWAMTAKPT
jgi:hypothetical protein